MIWKTVSSLYLYKKTTEKNVPSQYLLILNQLGDINELSSCKECSVAHPTMCQCFVSQPLEITCKLFTYFGKQSSVRYGVGEELSEFGSMPFCLIDSVHFLREAFHSLMRSQILSVDFSICVTDIMFRKLFYVPLCSRLFPLFCSIRISLYGFILRSLIQLNFIFMQGERYGSIYIYLFFLT